MPRHDLAVGKTSIRPGVAPAVFDKGQKVKGASPGTKLRRTLDKRPIMLPGAFNALSAQLIEAAGFQAMYISGAGLVNGVAGLPDIGLLSLTEVTAQVRYITEAVGIPAIADADTGFGEGLHLRRAVGAFEAAGAAGMQIEDQVFPKRCGHLAGKTLIAAKAMADKVKIAVSQRAESGFIIIARTDARGVTSFEDAVDRAKRYIDAGADIIFPEALQSAEEFEAFARAVDHPLMANMTEFGVSPLLPAETLFQMGYRIVLFPMTLFRIAAGAMIRGLETLKKEGNICEKIGEMQTREALYRLINYDVYKELDQLMASGSETREG
ncbi:MAG: oxaloacetate decarboxylase [Nitrospiria bacterium]